MGEDPKEVMRESFLEAPSLRDWVEERYGDDFPEWADLASMNAPEMWEAGYLLEFNWQREELYLAYASEVWAWLEEWAYVQSGHNDDVTIVDMLATLEYGEHLFGHEAFIDIVVTLALAQLAATSVRE